MADLYHRFAPDVRAWVARRTGDADRAEDITQEIFIRVLSRIGTFKLGNPVWPWLMAVARSACADAFRSESRRPTISLDAMDAARREATGRARVPAHDLAETRVMLRQALSPLSNNDRSTLWLQAIDDQSYEEIARRHRSTVDAVRNRNWRAKRMLQSMLTDLRSLFPPAAFGRAARAWHRARARLAAARFRLCELSEAAMTERVAGVAFGLSVLPLLLAFGGTPARTEPAPRPRAAVRASIAGHASQAPRAHSAATRAHEIARASARTSTAPSAVLPRTAHARVELIGPDGRVWYWHEANHACTPPPTALRGVVRTYC